MVMTDSQGELLSAIIQILVRCVILAVKYIIFTNAYTTSLASCASIFVSESIQSNVRHRLHCLVFTDTYLYNLTKEKLTM